MQVLGHEISAVAIDIDGTMAATLDVSRQGFAVLKRLTEAGIPVIVITGRSESAALSIADEAGITAPVISCNGSMTTDPVTRERLDVHPMDPEEVGRMLERTKALDLQPFVWDVDGIWTDRYTEATQELEHRNSQKLIVSEPPSSWGEVVKIMVSAEPEHLDSVQTGLEDFPQLQRCLPNFMEASAAGFSKWAALKAVLGRLGVDPANVLGFGDGDTDVEWLSAIGLPVAVENAAEDVHAIAAHTIGHHSEDSVAGFLEDALDGKL